MGDAERHEGVLRGVPLARVPEEDELEGYEPGVAPQNRVSRLARREPVQPLVPDLGDGVIDVFGHDVVAGAPEGRGGEPGEVRPVRRR